jgi:UDP-N-acetylmuramate dehydrogenase
MLLSPDDHDSWSAGSFFTNPIVTQQQADTLPNAAPKWPLNDGRVKISAAWLIENSGIHKGDEVMVAREFRQSMYLPYLIQEMQPPQILQN